MGRSQITCPRCGYITDHMRSYSTHILRKKMCKPLRSNVIPTTENVVRVTFAQQQERRRQEQRQQEHTAHPEEQPQQQNIVNVNSPHNNITVHHQPHLHPPARPRGLLSHPRDAMETPGSARHNRRRHEARHSCTSFVGQLQSCKTRKHEYVHATVGGRHR